VPCLKNGAEYKPAPRQSISIQAADGGDDVRRITWAYGVTTVPVRRKKLLPDTLASLREVGFPDPVLFLDGGDHRLALSYEDEFQLPVVNRQPKILTFGNWALGLAELYIRNPLCTYYAMFQDDFVCSKNLRSYLERVPYPDGGKAAQEYGYQTKGYWNLYTFDLNRRVMKKDTETRQVRDGWFASTQNGLGAVALVFDREAVWDLLTEKGHIVTRPAHAGERRWRNIDGGIVDAMKKQGRKEYVHNPSLIQHTGLVSSMSSNRHPQARTFRGVDFDCLCLLGEKSGASAAG
jgi:hypothetical protein